MGNGHLSILMLPLPCNVEFELAVHHPPEGDKAGTTLFQQVKVVINPGVGKKKMMISPHSVRIILVLYSIVMSYWKKLGGSKYPLTMIFAYKN